MFPVTIKITIDGIPCKAKVTRFQRHRGTKSRFAPDPDSYYGWIEMSYKILDRTGYQAKWLDALMMRKNLWEEVEDEIAREVEDEMQARKEDYQIQKRKDEGG